MSEQQTTIIKNKESGLRVDNCVTSGTFSLDGGTWEVDNNVWIIGNDVECAVIDPAHDPQAVVNAVAGRTITHVLLTHGHDDHIAAVREFVQRADTDAEIFMHPKDLMLWRTVFSDGPEPQPLEDNQEILAGTAALMVFHTPGHSPGSVVFYGPEVGAHGVLFSGDTLFRGGPGATGRSYSDFPTIIESIQERILTLPEETQVLTGHGDATTVGHEKPHLSEWIARGH